MNIKIPSDINYQAVFFALFASSVIFFFAVFTAVNFFFRICKYEDMIQSLLDRSDAARILAVNHVADFVRQMESFFVYDLRIFYNIYGNIMTNNVVKQFGFNKFEDDLWFSCLKHENKACANLTIGFVRVDF